jgi:hypothetical protein
MDCNCHFYKHWHSYLRCGCSCHARYPSLYSEDANNKAQNSIRDQASEAASYRQEYAKESADNSDGFSSLFYDRRRTFSDTDLL